MSTLGYVSEEEATGKVKEIFEDIKREKGIDFIPNPWRAMANDPDFLELKWNQLKKVMSPGKLDRLTKEIIAVAVSVTNSCNY